MKNTALFEINAIDETEIIRETLSTYKFEINYKGEEYSATVIVRRTCSIVDIFEDNEKEVVSIDFEEEKVPSELEKIVEEYFYSEIINNVDRKI